MSLSATCESVAQKRSLSSLLAGHVMKRPKQGDGQQLQEAAVQLLETQQNLSSLLREVGDLNPPASNSCVSGEAQQAASQKLPTVISGSLMASELRRQAARLGVPVTALSVTTILERLKEITGTEEGDEGRRPVLTSSQRGKLGVLMESCRDLLSQGALCPRLLWTGYRQEQEEPHLEVVQHLHRHSLLTLKEIIESDEGVRWWLLPRVKALCCWAPPQEEDKKVQRQLLITVVGVLVETGFRWSDEPTAADKKTLLLSRSVLDDMLFWLLDSLDTRPQSTPAGAQLWSELYDASLCEAAMSPDALQNFFTHSLTQTLTYKPQLTVSDAVTLQNQWTFPKTSRLLTSLFRRLAVTSEVEQLLRRLQQVLETHEVNWKHVLCFLSTLLVYSRSTQGCLRELLAKLLTSAFESYDLENMITAFLLARQGALEGPAVFLSYSEWFKVSFGGASSFHANSKKSLVFLLKFLSDLVPFEPPHYLKVHILHPPYVPLKHRGILMEYVSLAKTRLADLKESVEEMSLYDDVSASGATQDQAVQDVEKAVTLFESTGRISATIMEASIFRRTYFLTRFLPALLKPRPLPGKPDAWMSFIEALQKADKIPAAQHTAYAEACQKLRHGDGGSACGSSLEGPLQVLHLQLEELRQLVKASEAEMSAQLSRVAHTLSSIFPERPEDLTGRRVTPLPTDSPPSSPLHLKAVDMVLRVFCQCLLDASRTDPPNKQSDWASTSLRFLLSNTQLLSSLLHRLWHLLHHQGSSLEASHLLGLAALLVHLHVLVTSPVQLCPPSLPGPVSVSEALASALSCRTRGDMLFSVRVCVAAACYGMCRAESSSPDQPLGYVPSPIFKKLLYLLPRLMPECRRTPPAESAEEQSLWSSSLDSSSSSWRRTALRLWSLPVFRQPAPECQLSVAEWLTWELQVSRSEDALSDSERLEYHQWACRDHFLSAAETSGGCEGNSRSLVAHLLQAVMEHQLRKPRPQSSDTCLSDILGRLQDLVLDEELGALYCSRPDAPHLSDFLFELVSQRLLDTESVGAELAVTVWNRVLLALPSVCFIKVVTLGGRTTLDCTALVKHINLHQRRVCAAGGGLSFPVTSHFLKGLLRAATRCGPAEFNRCWTHISLQCPLLLVSTVLWWERLSAAATCRRDGADLPEPLQLLSSAHHWACSVRTGQLLQPPPPPASAPPLLLAAALYTARTAGDLSSALELLRPDTDSRHREVLVHLLFLAVSSYVSAWLRPQEWSPQPPLRLCSQVLARLAHWPDWLLLFTPDAASKAVALATPANVIRLLPWAFFSLLLQLSPQLLQQASSCPAFLLTALPCYTQLLQLFLDGPVPSPAQEVLGGAKRLLLRRLSEAPPLSSGQLAQLQSSCPDPEVAAALSAQLEPGSLSPEMDFL